MRPRDALTREEQDQLDEVRIACPDLAATCDLARVFTGLVRDRRGHLLADWLREAETADPARFAASPDCSARTGTPSSLV